MPQHRLIIINNIVLFHAYSQTQTKFQTRLIDDINLTADNLEPLMEVLSNALKNSQDVGVSKLQ